MTNNGNEAPSCFPQSLCAPFRNLFRQEGPPPLLPTNPQPQPVPPTANIDPQPEPPTANIDPPEVQRIARSNEYKYTLDDLPNNVPQYNSRDVKRANWANVRMGKGATATVWAGVIGGTPVAIKELNKGIPATTVQSEVNLLAVLNHDNIVGVKGVCFDGDHKYIFYELMEDSLDHRLFSSGEDGDLHLTWGERLVIASDIIKALQYLHEQFDEETVVIHRDIKPQNVLLDKSHRARIADFGCAVIVEKNDLPATDIPIIGTFGYLDPSYVTKGELTPASDIFAFGGILLDMITGKNSRPKIVIPEEVEEEFVASIKDPNLNDVSAEDLRKLVLMARSCRDTDWTKRPSASKLNDEILNVL